MAQTFNNGESNASIRTKLNGNAGEINEIVEETIPTLVPQTRTVAGKPLSSNVTLVKADVGLGNVDNTSDANKPVSTLQQTALDAKAPTASPTFTGTVSGVTKGMVGLGNVDNTSDANKPVSTAQSAAINARVPNTRTVAGKALISDVTLGKADVGLGNVDNTSDINKPISALTANALAEKATPADITTALDDATIYFDEATFEGAVYPVPVGEEPAVGTSGNPIKAKNAGGISIIDSVTNGNMNAVTSNAVYQAIQSLLGGYSGTLQDLYDLISSGLVTPEAPTSFIVDDVANTGDWTNATGYTDIGDYEYQINGGSITTATVKPFVVGDINAAIGDVKIRVKAVPGVSNASAWLTNPSAYTASGGAGLLPGGYSFLTINAQALNDEMVNEDNIWRIPSREYGGQGWPLKAAPEGGIVAMLYTADSKYIDIDLKGNNSAPDFFGAPAITLTCNSTGVVVVVVRDILTEDLPTQPTDGQYLAITYVEAGLPDDEAKVRISILDEDAIEVYGKDYFPKFLGENNYIQFSIGQTSTRLSYPQGLNLTNY